MSKKSSKKPVTTRPVTKHQRSANQQNAKKSTGPKTRKGKKRASLNALKHGLLAKEVIITTGDGTESQQEFNALLKDLLADLKPTGPVEETLVERIATCYWRLRRAQRFEIGAVRTSLDDCRRDHQRNHHTLIRLQSKHDQLSADLRHRKDFLAILQAITDFNETDPPSDTSVELRGLADDFRINHKKLSLEELYPHLLSAQKNLITQINKKIARLEEEIREEEYYQKLSQSRRRLTGSLPSHDTLFKLMRYETMLDRQLHRALSELRRRQYDKRTPPHQ